MSQALRDAVHQWQELQKLHLGDRDRLRRELAALQGHPLVRHLEPTLRRLQRLKRRSKKFCGSPKMATRSASELQAS